MKEIIIILFIFLPFTAFGQNSEVNRTNLLPNHIYSTAGVLLLARPSVSISYDRTLVESDKIQAGIRFGIGKYSGWADDGKDFLFNINLLTGKKTNHLQFDMGVRYSISNYESSGEPMLLVNLGYRWQKPGKHFLWGFGGGTEAFVHLYLGFAF